VRIELSNVTARRKELEALKERLDALVNQIKQLEVQLEKTEEQLEAAQVELQKSQEAAQTVKECRADYEAYQEAKKQLDFCEEKRDKRDELLRTKIELEGQIELNRDRAKQMETSLQEAEEAAERMEALQPLIIRQEQLENEIQTRREHLRELGSLQEQLQKLRFDMQQKWKRLKDVKKGLTIAYRLEGELQIAERKLQDARDEKSDVEKQQGILQVEAERLKEQMAALETAESAVCPVCEQPLSAAHRDELLARNRAQIEENHARWRMLDQQVAKLSNEISEIEDRCASLGSQLRQLPRAAERADLVVQLVELRAERTRLRRRVAELEGVPQHLQSLEDEKRKLGDPHNEYNRLLGIAQKHESIVRQIASARREIERLQGELTQVETKLLPYADLDTITAQLRARMAALEPSYKCFLENSPLAEMLPQRHERVERLRLELQNLGTQCEQCSKERDRVAKEFDPNELEALREEERSLQSEQSRLGGEFEILREQLRQLEHEIEEIKHTKEELQQAREKLKQLERTDQVIEFVRNVIHRAGPHMVRLLAAGVSAVASRIFRDIMEDPTVRLHWKEDYGIALEADGRERDFEQLSGGEQMAAALAVRLALLRELSAVDVVFFDEPTSNLDSTRRENLAEQIAVIRNTGLSQLFVISHDDTFEQVTDHVVRVRKEHGESIVETL
ncbi:MAG: AAA family ATPase, partial [Anaerolineae bacterium]